LGKMLLEKHALGTYRSSFGRSSNHREHAKPSNGTRKRRVKAGRRRRPHPLRGSKKNHLRDANRRIGRRRGNATECLSKHLNKDSSKEARKSQENKKRRRKERLGPGL